MTTTRKRFARAIAGNGQVYVDDTDYLALDRVAALLRKPDEALKTAVAKAIIITSFGYECDPQPSDKHIARAALNALADKLEKE